MSRSISNKGKKIDRWFCMIFLFFFRTMRFDCSCKRSWDEGLIESSCAWPTRFFWLNMRIGRALAIFFLAHKFGMIIFLPSDIVTGLSNFKFARNISMFFSDLQTRHYYKFIIFTITLFVISFIPFLTHLAQF